ncbi:Protein CWC16 [Cucumispora dikerogammari]|nr:Protein CWC16 [Cucumispora dikerogammari]
MNIKLVKKIREKKHKNVRFCIPFALNCGKCKAFYDKNKRIYATKYVVMEKFEVYYFKFVCRSCKDDVILQTDLKSASYLPYYNCISNMKLNKETNNIVVFSLEEKYKNHKNSIQKILDNLNLTDEE